MLIQRFSNEINYMTYIYWLALLLFFFVYYPTPRHQIQYYYILCSIRSILISSTFPIFPASISLWSRVFLLRTMKFFFSYLSFVLWHENKKQNKIYQTHTAHRVLYCIFRIVSSELSLSVYLYKYRFDSENIASATGGNRTRNLLVNLLLLVSQAISVVVWTISSVL